MTKKSKSSKKNKISDKGSGDKVSKKKKEKKSKQKSVDLMLPEVAKLHVEEDLLIEDLSKTNGKKSAKGSDEVEEAILVEPHPKGTKTEKHKKSKKESKDKDSKRNKSSSKKGNYPVSLIFISISLNHTGLLTNVSLTLQANTKRRRDTKKL